MLFSFLFFLIVSFDLYVMFLFLDNIDTDWHGYHIFAIDEDHDL